MGLKERFHQYLMTLPAVNSKPEQQLHFNFIQYSSFSLLEFEYPPVRGEAFFDERDNAPQPRRKRSFFQMILLESRKLEAT